MAGVLYDATERNGDGGMIDPVVLGKWLRDSAAVLSILKQAADLLPKGNKKCEQLDQAVARAEEALRRNESAIAKELGFHLCKCTFPPQIMLWREKEAAFVYQKATLGREDDLRRSPNAWIA